MASQISECYDICPDMGGIAVTIACVNSPSGVIHRTGSSEEYKVSAPLRKSVGNTYTFEIPAAVFAFPIGYYDLDILDGTLLKKTIRLNLHTSGLASQSTVITTDCTDNRSIDPNTALVVDCVCPTHGTNECTPEECTEGKLIVLGACSDDPSESVPTEISFGDVVEGTPGSQGSTVFTSSGGQGEVKGIRVGSSREIIGSYTAQNRAIELAKEASINNAIRPKQKVDITDNLVVDDGALADQLNDQFISGER